MADDRATAGSPRSHRLSLALLLAGPLLIVAGIVAGDRIIAGTVGHDLPGAAALYQVVDVLDLLTGKDVTNFLLGGLLILIATAINRRRRRGLLSGNVMYVGLVQLLTTTVADLLKPVFGRARPFQAAADGHWSDLWFAGGHFGSFPSGHMAFYVGLCFPIALLHRKFAMPLLLAPTLVAIERMGSHDHYMTDVGASVLLGAAIAVTMARSSVRTLLAGKGRVSDG